MADEESRGAAPRPGTAMGEADRRRLGELTSTVLDRPTRRRAGVFRRALRREASRLRDPRRIAAILLLSLTFCDPAGRDDRARRAGRRRCARLLGRRPLWINGGNPYAPSGPFMPYVYAPWMLPFAPWALLPWDVASLRLARATILGLLWTIHWAYSRRPLTTAVIVASSRSRSARTSIPATSICS